MRSKAAEEEESHDKLLKDLKQQIRDAENDKLAAWDTCKQSVSSPYESLTISTALFIWHRFMNLDR